VSSASLTGNGVKQLMGWAMWYYDGEDFPVLQAVYPDLENRFPENTGFDVAFEQPLMQPIAPMTRVEEDFWAIKTVEFGWPVGMPVCRSIGGGIYEVRPDLAQNRIARVLFYFDKNGRMVLLHGFIKKTQKTPEEDLELARRNKKKHERSQ
jgi:phage-related protein